MSTADLYTPDFPHGTPDGYEQGCRGAGGCPNRGDAERQTCKEAQLRYQRDPAYKRLVKSAAPLEQLAAKEAGAPLPPVLAKPKPRPRIPELHDAHTLHLPPTGRRLDGLRQDITDLEEALTAPPARKGKLSPDDPAFSHGTTYGARNGCKDPTTCPGHPDTGITCTEARNAYNRDYYKNHKTSPGEGSAPTPNVPAENQTRETGGTTPAETEATIRTPEPSTVDHTPPTPDEPWHDPTHGQIDHDIQNHVNNLEPGTLGQRAALEHTLQRLRDSGQILTLDEYKRRVEEAGEEPDIEVWHPADAETVIDAYIENAVHDAARIKTLIINLEETRDELREAYGDAHRATHDYGVLWLAHEKLRNDRTIDTQLIKLIPALAANPVSTVLEVAQDATPPAADLLVQPQADGSIRVALRGGSEPMRLHVGFQDGQPSTVSVSIGGN